MDTGMLAGFASVIATILASSVSIAYWLGGRFEAIEGRLREIVEMISGIEKRVEKLESRLDKTMKMNASYVETIYSMLVDFMGIKGLFTREEVGFLVTEMERVTKMHLATLNPLKPEEAKFILEVVGELKEKDLKDFDLSKLDRVIEIARRWLWEDPEPDAARLLFIAYTLKAIIRKERGEY